MSASAPYHPSALGYYAALLEAAQAERDLNEAWCALVASGERAGSPEDYALWHAGAYADAAHRVVRDLPVWSTT